MKAVEKEATYGDASWEVPEELIQQLREGELTEEMEKFLDSFGMSLAAMDVETFDNMYVRKRRIRIHGAQSELQPIRS